MDFFHFFGTFDQTVDFVLATNTKEIAARALDNEELPNEWYTTPRKINDKIQDLVTNYKDWLRDYVTRHSSDFWIEEIKYHTPDIEYIEVPEKL